MVMNKSFRKEEDKHGWNRDMVSDKDIEGKTNKQTQLYRLLWWSMGSGGDGKFC